MTTRFLKARLACAVTFAISGVAMNASANDTESSSNTRQIEKIIVKGQKIDRTLQETPTSVAVITRVTMITVVTSATCCCYYCYCYNILSLLWLLVLLL